MRILLMLVLLTAAGAMAAPPPIQLEGDYPMQRRVPIYDPERERWHDARVEDCLHIGEALADGRRPLRLFSVQANGHSCSLSGLAEEVAGELSLNVATVDGKACAVRLRMDRRALRVEAKGPGCWDYCGARAHLDGIQYLRSGRRPPGAECAAERR